MFLKTLDAKPAYTDEELQRFEAELRDKEEELKRKAETLRQEQELLRERGKALEAQKREYQQVTVPRRTGGGALRRIVSQNVRFKRVFIYL